MKILKKLNKQKIFYNLIYNNNIKKKKLSKFNILFIKSGFIF